jgi:hypothetical protein
MAQTFQISISSTDDGKRLGRTSVSRNIPMLPQIVDWTVREAAEGTRACGDWCYIILAEDLGMHLVWVKFMPKHLTEDQIIQRISACEDLQRQNDGDILLKNLATEMRPRLIRIVSKLNDSDRYGTVLIRHTPKKGPTSALESENSVYLFLFRLSRHCSLWVRSSEPDGQSSLLSGRSQSCLGWDTKRTAGNVDCRNMAPPSRQCTSSHSVVDSRDVGKPIDSCSSTTFLFAWTVPTRLLCIPQNKNYIERKKRLSGRGRHDEYDRPTESSSADNLWTVLEKSGKRRWEHAAQGDYFIRINMTNCKSWNKVLFDEFQEPYEQTS